jgi:hypothetical protein
MLAQKRRVSAYFGQRAAQRSTAMRGVNATQWISSASGKCSRRLRKPTGSPSRRATNVGSVLVARTYSSSDDSIPNQRGSEQRTRSLGLY